MSLENLFDPDNIAVVGASRHEGKIGHEIFDNLIHGFKGNVYPVNSNAESVEGEKAFDGLKENTDLAVIVVPARNVPDVIRDCGRKNIGTAIVVSSGFSDTGNNALESEIKYVAEDNEVKILGPNVLGLINTENSMNASFASEMPAEGKISLMSQSGALCTAMLDYSRPENIGFRHVISLGNKMMIDETDLMQKWREDNTDLILSYVENIEKGRKFIEEAIKTTSEKPVIVMKTGGRESKEELNQGYNGSADGGIGPYRAVFRKTGIIEAQSHADLLKFGKAFLFQPLPKGKNVAVITNAAGPGALALNEISKRDMKSAELSDKTLENLRKVLPEEANLGNPIDIMDDAGHRRYRDVFENVKQDENIDSILIILTPQANTQIIKTARNLAEEASETDKTVIACFMGEEDILDAKNLLEDNEIPVNNNPGDSVRSIHAMETYREFLDSDTSYKDFDYDEKAASEALKNSEAHDYGGKILEAYGIETALTDKAESPEAAVKTASRIGYPVTLKIDSRDLTHKSDFDGIKRDLNNREDVKTAFRDIMENAYSVGNTIKGVKVQENVQGIEVTLGMKRDPRFGPIITIGLAGTYVEALNNISFGISPITEQEADNMIRELKSSEFFNSIQGGEHSFEPIKDAIIRLGELSLNHTEISEIELNPIVLDEDRAHVADIEFVIN